MEQPVQPCPMEQEELTPTYYVQCSYFWPEFIDKGSFVYSEVHFCSYKKELDCKTLEAAEQEAAAMNEQQIVCPLCGKRGKFKATTNYDMANEKRIMDQIVNNTGHIR